MTSPVKKKRCLDLLDMPASPKGPLIRTIMAESPRRSPRIEAAIANSPRRSPRIKAAVSSWRNQHSSPRKLFPSSISKEQRRRESMPAMSFYGPKKGHGELEGGSKASSVTLEVKRSTKVKNKKWSQGPRLGGKGILVGKANNGRGQKRSRSLSNHKRQRTVSTEPKPALKTQSPTLKPVLQELSLGTVKLNIVDDIVPAGERKFFKSRSNRPETRVVKTGFDIKFSCDVNKKAQLASNPKNENTVRKKRPLAVVGGQEKSKLKTATTPRAVKSTPKGTSTEYPGANVIYNSPKPVDKQKQDISSKVISPKTPRTLEEEMLANWGFDDQDDDVVQPSPVKLKPKDILQAAQAATEKPSDECVITAADISNEESRDSVDTNSSVENEPAQSKAKAKLFPIFNNGSNTPKSISALDRLRFSESPSPAGSPGSTSSKQLKSFRQSPKLLRPVKDRDGKEQYMLDAGQKLTGLIQCATCGMNYNGDNPEDKNIHENFHDDIMKTLYFPGWKTENVVREFSDGSRIIVVNADNKKQMIKVEKIRELVDQELGFVQRKSIMPNRKVFLYVSEKKEIVGYCLAEPIEKAFKVLPESPMKMASPSSKKPWRCSTVAQTAKCGVNRIWVFHAYRHQGIATKLLDCVRYNFLVGCPLPLEEIAYTDPTPDGRALFTKYNNHAEYLVYN